MYYLFLEKASYSRARLHFLIDSAMPYSCAFTHVARLSFFVPVTIRTYKFDFLNYFSNSMPLSVKFLTNTNTYLFWTFVLITYFICTLLPISQVPSHSPFLCPSTLLLRTAPSTPASSLPSDYLNQPRPIFVPHHPTLFNLYNMWIF